MNPQPLSRVNPRAEIRTLQWAEHWEMSAELHQLVLKVIGLASQGDQFLARLFARLLHANPIPSYATYARIESASVRKTVLQAAAQSTLSKEDYPWFEAAIKSVGAPYKVRNAFCHQIWGHSPDVSDALLLIDPEVFTQTEVLGLQTLISADRGELTEEQSQRAMALDYSKIMVWSHKSLEKAAEEMLWAARCLNFVGDLFAPKMSDNVRDRLREYLLEWPRFREAFEKLDKGSAPVEPI